MQKLSFRSLIGWSWLLLALLCSTILAACGTTATVASPTSSSRQAASAPSQPPQQAEVKIEKGGRAPNLVATDINGKLVQLSDFKGKAVLVNFFTTW